MAADFFEREYRTKISQLYAGDGKCRVESEVILPDYKEEAHRVIRVDPKLRIHQKNVEIQGQNLVCEIEGVATFNLLYLTDRHGEKGCPSSFVSQENFSYQFKIPLGEEKLDPEEIFCMTELFAENISFKLLGPRKVSMRCEVTILLDVKCGRQYAFCSRPLDSDVETVEKSCRFGRHVCTHQEEHTISETISLPEAYLPIGEVCDLDVVLYASGVRAEAGGVSFRGNAALSCSYVSSEEEQFISFFQPIEFQKSRGMDQVEAGDWVQISLTPNFLKATTDVNENGENKNVLFEVGYTEEIRVFRNEEVRVLEDAFSTKNRLNCQKESLLLEEVCGITDYAQTLRETVSFQDDGFVRCEGIRSRVDFRNSYVEDGKIVLEGRLHFGFLGIRENGDPTSVESYHDFSCTVSPEKSLAVPTDEECRIEVCGGVRSLDIVCEEKNLQLRIELYGNLTLYCRHRIQAITQMERGEEIPCGESGILYVYPGEQETLWDLCKRYGISPKTLCEENSLDPSSPLPPVLRFLI